MAWHVLLQSDTKTLGEKDMSKFLQRVGVSPAGDGALGADDAHPLSGEIEIVVPTGRMEARAAEPIPAGDVGEGRPVELAAMGAARLVGGIRFEQQRVQRHRGDHGAQFSRGKCSVYEAGLRIPMIISWPGHCKAGEVRRELVSTLDLVPTMLAAADVRAQPQLPGKPLQPLGSRPPWGATPRPRTASPRPESGNLVRDRRRSNRAWFSTG